MSSPTYTQLPDSLWRLQVDPTFVGGTGSMNSCLVQAFFDSMFVNNADPTDTFVKQLGSVNVDYIADANKPVTFTFEGSPYTMAYGLIAAGMTAAAFQEWNAPAPTGSA